MTEIATTKRVCTATATTGEQCKARPLRGTELCGVHTPDHPVAASFAPGHPFIEGSGRPAKRRVIDGIREKIEADFNMVWEPLSGALTCGDGTAADHQVRLAAARELLDRAYGKPRQQVEHSGPDGGPITLAHLAQRAEDDE